MKNLFTAADLEHLIRSEASSKGLEVTSVVARQNDLYGHVVDVRVKHTPQSYQQYRSLCLVIDAAFRARGQDAPQSGWYEREGNYTEVELHEGEALMQFDLLVLRD